MRPDWLTSKWFEGSHMDHSVQSALSLISLIMSSPLLVDTNCDNSVLLDVDVCFYSLFSFFSLFLYLPCLCFSPLPAEAPRRVASRIYLPAPLVSAFPGDPPSCKTTISPTILPPLLLTNTMVLSMISSVSSTTIYPIPPILPIQILNRLPPLPLVVEILSLNPPLLSLIALPNP